MRRAHLSLLASLLGAAGAASLVGCASTPSSGSAGDTPKKPDQYVVEFRRDAPGVREELPAPVETVWDALPKAFKELGYTAGPSTGRSERVYLTPHMRIRGRLYPDAPNSAFLDCGRTPAGGLAADEYAVTFAVIVRVEPTAAGGSRVEAALDGTALEQTQSSTRVYCTGTGRIEGELLRLIAKHATSPG